MGDVNWQAYFEAAMDELKAAVEAASPEDRDAILAEVGGEILEAISKMQLDGRTLCQKFAELERRCHEKARTQ